MDSHVWNKNSLVREWYKTEQGMIAYDTWWKQGENHPSQLPSHTMRMHPFASSPNIRSNVTDAQEKAHCD